MPDKAGAKKPTLQRRGFMTKGDEGGKKKPTDPPVVLPPPTYDVPPRLPVDFDLGEQVRK